MVFMLLITLQTLNTFIKKSKLVNCYFGTNQQNNLLINYFPVFFNTLFLKSSPTYPKHNNNYYIYKPSFWKYISLKNPF